jgi:aminoglycoside 3-N-acetyltransferase
MENRILFTGGYGPVSNADLLSAGRKVGADDCDVLFVHTEINFGAPALKRQALLAALLETLESLRTETLIFPVFTFSFCNREPFDVQNSATSMGILNDFARKNGKGTRSKDPLLSVYTLGIPISGMDNLGIDALGKDSGYDRLHNCGKRVKFLFFGADMRACFTYTHYVEAVFGVPYRYNRVFEGSVIDCGMEFPNRQALLYTCYANCALKEPFCKGIFFNKVYWRRFAQESFPMDVKKPFVGASFSLL